ncbi:MAG: sigma-70 family RNA polymerase sigma factor [Lentisphaeraceae bacterium]|nr:sigma-70 family RNA polymerase sigma factor [Lentisphaeraceae bacterium]
MKEVWIREMLEQYEGPLLRYAFKLCKDLELAQDAVQDTFMKLCREDRNKVESYLAKWLFTVCRNRIFEILRKENRMQTLDQVQLEKVVERDRSPADSAELSDDKTVLRELMVKLPAKEQEVLRLKFQNGLSYKEISDITKLTVSNVGFILHKTIKELKGQFHKKSDTSGGLS